VKRVSGRVRGESFPSDVEGGVCREKAKTQGTPGVQGHWKKGKKRTERKRLGKLITFCLGVNV